MFAPQQIHGSDHRYQLGKKQEKHNGTCKKKSILWTTGKLGIIMNEQLTRIESKGYSWYWFDSEDEARSQFGDLIYNNPDLNNDNSFEYAEDC